MQLGSLRQRPIYSNAPRDPQGPTAMRRLKAAVRPRRKKNKFTMQTDRQRGVCVSGAHSFHNTRSSLVCLQSKCCWDVFLIDLACKCVLISCGLSYFYFCFLL